MLLYCLFYTLFLIFDFILYFLIFLNNVTVGKAMGNLWKIERLNLLQKKEEETF